MSWKPSKRKSRLPNWIPEWVKVATRVGFKLTLIILVLGICIAGYYFYKASTYDLSQVAKIQETNVLLDNEGQEFDSVNASSRKLAKKEDLPQHLKDALLAREDSNFYEHCGVDFKGLARATVRNIQDMAFTQGASTISMQLVKNTWDNREKNLNRKFLELALTFRIESHFDKDEIMTCYLNRIYFGAGCYGIEEAAQTYFGVPTKKLSLGQSALLAGIIRAPHDFSPFNDLDSAIEQRDQTLARMVTINKITQSQADNAKKTPLGLVKKNDDKNQKSYALNAISRHLAEVLQSNDIRHGGLHITTTIDTDLLKKTKSDIASLISKTPDLQAAALVIENKTGAVLAIIGGRDYETAPYNRALDSRIDLGDAFTPFIYIAALERDQLAIPGEPVPTGKQIGEQETIRISKRLGIGGPFKTTDLFRGTVQATPLELATAFSTIGSSGLRPYTHFIKKITTTNGTVIFDNHPEPSQVIEAGNAIETLELLRTTTKGTKSYTTSAFSDLGLWSMATSKNKTAILWIGNDIPKKIPNATTLKEKMRTLTTNWVN